MREGRRGLGVTMHTASDEVPVLGEPRSQDLTVCLRRLDAPRLDLRAQVLDRTGAGLTRLFGTRVGYGARPW